MAGPLAIALIALAAGAVIAAVLLAGGGDGRQASGADSAQRPAQAQAPTETTRPETTPPQTTPTDTAPAEPPAPAPADPGIDVDPAPRRRPQRAGLRAHEPGRLRGRCADPAAGGRVLAQESTDIDYAYALYNLGKALNRSGNAAAAIPYLEKRLNWSNQRGVVKQELRLARQNAGQG